MKDACILHLPSTAISWILKVWMTVVKRERKRKKERKKEKEGEKERERRRERKRERRTHWCKFAMLICVHKQVSFSPSFSSR